MNDQDDEKSKKEDNVVSMADSRKKATMNKKDTSSSNPQISMFNLPPATQILALVMITVFFMQQFMPPEGKLSFFNTLGFVPSDFTELSSGSLLTLITPVSYMFIHGTLLHLLMNTLMLVAFGTGVERWLGTTRFLMVFFVCGICAAFVHFAYSFVASNVFDFINMGRTVIGASGATSGLFAVGIIYLQKSGSGIGAGPHGLYPLIAVFVAISVIFGITGSTEGQSVAWVAHIGGFFTGLGILKLMKKL